jgi:hypothetical protein
MFGDFEHGDASYQKLSDINALIPRLDEALEWYNNENNPMNLVFFGDCI